ncbi:zinc finger protein 771-like [Uranotaenia lowii]|uniref:zinc finger protein 771-like n=1 Tax=Uranotaenia lowii TaxID=190385 RepID=UPI00247A3B75|nr:zinc finger protein 771-like [Uranotaenia lowii]XP_055586138.1 zinc finger protein 771-like [Uranotaenia lowii]
MSREYAADASNISQPVSEALRVMKPRKSNQLVCRLCGQSYAKQDVEDILGRNTGWKKKIMDAVGIKIYRLEQTNRICTVCQTMIETIISFQLLCRDTQVSLHDRTKISPCQRWKDAKELIGNVRDLIEFLRITSVGKEHAETEADCNPLSISEPLSSSEIGRKSDEEQQTNLGQRETEQTVEVPNDQGDEPSEQDNDHDEELPQRKTSQTKRDRKAKMGKQERIMCDTCGELVSQLSLEGHLNRHRGVKPFVCEIEGCGRQLYSKYSLHQHRHLHKSIMRYYDCDKCGKRIKGTNCWLRHRKLHTEEPKFPCDVCGKKFRRKFNLKLHASVHTGVAMFPCEICGKRFTVKHNLGAHYRTHMKNGTYPAEMDEMRGSEGNLESTVEGPV